MATYILKGYKLSDFEATASWNDIYHGDDVSLDPNWDVSQDALTFTITDNDSLFSGDGDQNEIGDDSTQSAVVTDALGNTVASGRIYIEERLTWDDGAGHVVDAYVIEVDGVGVGILTSVEITPGVMYRVSDYANISDINQPLYSVFSTPLYDPDLAQTYNGGAYNDEIVAGAGDDTINAGTGADNIDGGAGNDTIYYGTGGATQADGDTVYGGDGDDIIDDTGGVEGAAYDDTLYGDAGNDTIYGGGGDDEIYGGADNDFVVGETGDDELHGGTGDDELYGGDGFDLIWGDDGDDVLNGGADDDQLSGGTGHDMLYGEVGNDTLDGGDGNDWLSGGAGTDTLSGGAGNDTFYVIQTDGTTQMYGDDDWDFVDFSSSIGSAVDVTFTADNAFTFDFDTGQSSGSGNSMEEFLLTGQNDTVDASLDATGATYDLGAGDDTFTGGSGHDAVYGGDGADAIALGAGGDYAEGGAGNDTIYGDAGEDWIEGGTGNDTLYGGDDADTFFYSDGWGADTVYGGSGGTDADTLDFSSVTSDITVTFSDWEDGIATDGINTVSFDNIEAVSGGTGADVLNASADGSGISLRGGGGDDTITAGSGDDVIDAGADDDTITGGAGDDTISTGAGNDTVVFADGFGNDIITDFDFTDSNADGITDDQLDVSALTDSDGNPVNAWDVVVSDDGSGNAVLTFPNGESITLTGIAPTQVDGAQQMHAIGIPCFVSGTRIMTPSGNRLIEELRHGDLVSTLNSGAQPILWAGRTTLKRARLALQPDLLPIRIRDGTLGNSGDLWVSPQHGLVLPDPCSHAKAGVLVRAKHLLEHGDGRVRRAHGSRDVTYHHLLLPRHALILANGCASESLFPGRFALSGFDRAAKAELFDLFPALETILRSGAPATDAARMYGQPVLRFAKGRDWRAGHIRLPQRA